MTTTTTIVILILILIIIIVVVVVVVVVSGLFFTPRCPQDTGNYTVKAVNDYGLESASAFVHIVCQSLYSYIIIVCHVCCDSYFYKNFMNLER